MYNPIRGVADFLISRLGKTRRPTEHHGLLEMHLSRIERTLARLSRHESQSEVACTEDRPSFADSACVAGIAIFSGSPEVSCNPCLSSGVGLGPGLEQAGAAGRRSFSFAVICFQSQGFCFRHGPVGAVSSG